MKAWQKGAIVGAVWGIISVLFIMMGVAEKSTPSPIYYYLLSAPAWILAIIGGAIFRSPNGALLFVLAPLVYFLIGAYIGRLYEKRRGS